MVVVTLFTGACALVATIAALATALSGPDQALTRWERSYGHALTIVGAVIFGVLFGASLTDTIRGA